MIIKQNLELIEIKRNDKNTNADLIFLDLETNKTYSVHMNRQKWNKKTEKFEDDEEKATKVDNLLTQELGVTFENLETAIGETHDIYVYEDKERPFNSLFEVNEVSKPDELFFKKYRGGIETTIDEIEDTGDRIRIIFKVENTRYYSSITIDKDKLRYGDWINSRNQFLPNALLEKKAYQNFQKIFNLPFERKDELINHKIKIYPAQAGKNYYLEFEYIGE
ncbi:MAG: hypothetical protein CfP315_0777 [Candidatus Improbicoccus pseudotrichonymphae]|uniref:Uncharacterized protein n=1 Tax=Candidatus Improbicoccus pseudotrichonymphae TaxID=3033792 RepID=A0AA48HYQ2_9FIRM|nr:MAG: hypothetical protein CfP315_0777 [Candidatus Improbicoccus pseudotrichonymphae]